MTSRKVGTFWVPALTAAGGPAVRLRRKAWRSYRAFVLKSTSRRRPRARQRSLRRQLNCWATADRRRLADGTPRPSAATIVEAGRRGASGRGLPASISKRTAPKPCWRCAAVRPSSPHGARAFSTMRTRAGAALRSPTGRDHWRTTATASCIWPGVEASPVADGEEHRPATRPNRIAARPARLLLVPSRTVGERRVVGTRR